MRSLRYPLKGPPREGLIFLWGFLPAYIRITEAMAATGAGAQYRNQIWLRQSVLDDAGLMLHEAIHVVQWYLCALVLAVAYAAIPVLIALLLGVAWMPWGLAAGVLVGTLAFRLRGVALHGDLYHKQRWYRLWAEVWAYRAQLQHYPERTDAIAAWLASDASGYRLNITIDQAKEMLK